MAQTASPEILLLDDGSTDGTSDMVRSEFPEVRLFTFTDSKGYIVRRNEGARLATGAIIFSIDDDAEFSSPHVIEQTLQEFSDPCFGAVAIPYIEPHKDNRLMQQAPDAESLWKADRYIGTAHAVRRKLFLELGGYRENLIHQGEEGDFCIRMLNAGFLVRLGTSDPIIHNESPKRNLERMDYYGCRNAILFIWQNVPTPWLIPNLLMTTINCLKWTFIPSRFAVRIKGIVAGFILVFAAERHPVSNRTFIQWRGLGRAPCILETL